MQGQGDGKASKCGKPVDALGGTGLSALTMHHVKCLTPRVCVKSADTNEVIGEGPVDFDDDVLFDQAGVVKEHLEKVVKQSVAAMTWTQGLSEHQRAQLAAALVDQIANLLAGTTSLTDANGVSIFP